MMTLQVNPGCAFPALPDVPDVEGYLNNLVTSAAADLAAQAAAAATSQSAAIAYNIAIVNAEVAKQIAFYQDEATRTVDLIEDMLNVPCPCLPVPDSEATEIL
jgi:hypothetical protein